MNRSQPSNQRFSRIPATLQAVFLASNRGKDVHKPPPDSVAYRTFFRNWWASSKGKKKERNNVKENEEACQKVRATEEVIPPPSPQAVLEALLNDRRYSTERYSTLHSAYYNKPTALQKASYHVHLIQLVKEGHLEQFRAILQSGISPNPCNAFGESIVHMVCRRGAYDFLQVLLEVGCCVQVADDYGRTALHDACWAAQPCLDVVKVLLQRDARLFFLHDRRGSLPLDYVHKDHYMEWNAFLQEHADTFWPHRPEHDGPQGPPALVMWPADSRPIPSPHKALTEELAAQVASGKLDPMDARHIMDRDVETASLASTTFHTSMNVGDDEDLMSSSSECDSDEYLTDYDSSDSSDLGLDNGDLQDMMGRQQFAMDMMMGGGGGKKS